MQIDFSKFDGVNVQVLFVVLWFVHQGEVQLAHRVFLCNDENNDTSFTTVSLLSLFMERERIPNLQNAINNCDFLFRLG